MKFIWQVSFDLVYVQRVVATTEYYCIADMITELYYCVTISKYYWVLLLWYVQQILVIINWISSSSPIWIGIYLHERRLLVRRQCPTCSVVLISAFLVDRHELAHDRTRAVLRRRAGCLGLPAPVRPIWGGPFLPNCNPHLPLAQKESAVVHVHNVGKHSICTFMCYQTI